MINTTNELIRHATRAGHPVDKWDAIIVCSLHARLNSSLRYEWDKSRGQENFPKVEDMTSFLARSANHVENDVAMSGPMYIRVQNEYAATRQRAQHETMVKYACSFCSSFMHDNESCSKYVDSSLAVRNRMISEGRICRNCLKGGHFQDQCYSPQRCDMPKCGKARHHPTLCPYKEPRQDMVAAAARFQDADGQVFGGYDIKRAPAPSDAGVTPQSYLFPVKNRAGRGAAKRHGGQNDS